MFATSGYFRGLACPYFTSGLCERPYCHFKHVKDDHQDSPVADNEGEKSYAEELGFTNLPRPAGNKASLLNMVGDAIKQVQRDIDKAQGPAVHRFMKYNMVKPNVGQAKYKPTPINKETGKVEVQPDGHAQMNQPDPPRRKHVPQQVPEYKPTPIHLLKKRAAATSETTSSNPMDYDPVANFSTSQSASQPRISLGRSGKDFLAKRKSTVDAHLFEEKRRRMSADIEAKFSDDEPEEGTAENVENKGHGEEQKDLDSNENSNKANTQPTSSEKSDLASQVDKQNGEDQMNATEDDKTCTTIKSPRDTSTDNTCPDTCAGKSSPKQDLAETVETTSNSKQNSSCAVHTCTCGKNNTTDVTVAKDPDKKDNEISESKELTSTRNQRTVSGSSERSCSDKSKSGEKDSEKENCSKKDKDRERHKSSKHKKERGRSSGDEREKKHSSSEHKRSDKSGSSSSKSHKHHSSRDKGKSTSSKKSSGSSSGKGASSSSKHSSKSSHTSRHKHRSSSSNGKDSHHNHKTSSSSKSNHKSHHNHTTGSSSKSHHKSHKAEKSSTHGTNIFDAITSTKPHLKHSVSHAELFGDDSDSEKIKKEKELRKRSSSNDSGIKMKSSTVASESDSDDSDFIEISSVSSNNSVKQALLTAEDFDFSDHDPYDECLSIFNEKSVRKQEPEIVKVKPDIEYDNPASSGKPRVGRATEDRIKILKREASEKNPHRPSPAQVMHNRFVEMQRRAEQKSTLGGSTLGKKRMARLPSNHGATNNGKLTISTVPKTSSGPSKREAHVPQVSVKLPRPNIPTEFGSKIPSKVRQQYLNRIIDECQNIYVDDQDAFDRGLSEEKAVYERAKSKMIYLNVAINTIKRLRDEAAGGMSSPSITKNPKAFSHEAVLGGKNAQNCTYTLNRTKGPKKELENLTGATLYKFLAKYILTESQLEENGFPRQSEESTAMAVILSPERQKRVTRDPNEHVCVRCGTRFVVLPDGQYKRKEDCIHHWGKCWKKKIAGSIDNYWTCCQGESGAKGCSISKYHVHDDNKRGEMSGYQQTMPCSPPIDGDYGVFAMDCEMVYTTHGCELARVTVVDSKLNPVLDKLVKPDHHVVDYNTRFSGLTKEMLKKTNTSIRGIQAVLLNMFSDKTILIGHSLESDLVALKLIHNTVVDTSVVFPHRLGPPFKRALRNLASEILQKIIQENEGGHDSHEDAGACMELMIHKLKEDAKHSR